MDTSTPFIYLDIDEYERIRFTSNSPNTWCTSVKGYWVIIVPEVVYELEYRGLLSDEDRLSVYIERKLTDVQR